jgi:hypothetical protein
MSSFSSTSPGRHLAGADPVALLKRYGDRIQLVHVKDMRAGDRRIETAGDGVIDFRGSLRPPTVRRSTTSSSTTRALVTRRSTRSTPR